MKQRLQTATVIAFDWETTPYPYWDKRFAPLGLALACNPTESYYIAIGHRPPKKQRLFEKVYSNLELDEVCRQVTQLFAKISVLVAHNTKFDVSVSETVGLDLRPYSRLYDTYIASALTNTTQERRLGLKSLTEAWLKRKSAEITDVVKDKDLSTAPLDQVVMYAGDDACNALELYYLTKKRMEQAGSRVQHVFQKLEMPVSHITAKMERRGVRVDIERLLAIKAHAENVEARALKTMREYVKFPFDPGRHQHVHTVLYDLLCIPASRRAGKETADKGQLKLYFETMPQDLKDKVRPFFQAFLDYKEANKIRTTYTTAIIDRVESDGRIHPAFLQVNAASGRFTSRSPNFQNIPRDDNQFDVRSAFIPDPGHVFILADYTQMEFKIASAFSKDPVLIAGANDSTIDVHTNTARAIFGVSEHMQVTKDQRQAAKTITYAVQYGASSFALSRLLMISEREAQNLIDKFFAAYSGLYEWIQRTRRLIKQQGYVETFYGRRRWADRSKLDSSNERIRDEEFRKLVNTSVQGTGADVIKIAMKLADRYFQEQGTQAQIVGQIHDELVVLCPTEEIDIVKKLLLTAMVNDATRIENVVLPVDIEVKSSLSKSKSALIATEERKDGRKTTES